MIQMLGTFVAGPVPIGREGKGATQTLFFTTRGPVVMQYLGNNQFIYGQRFQSLSENLLMRIGRR